LFHNASANIAHIFILASTFEIKIKSFL
jgi:hypothetical protein